MLALEAKQNSLQQALSQIKYGGKPLLGSIGELNADVAGALVVSALSIPVPIPFLNLIVADFGYHAGKAAASQIAIQSPSMSALAYLVQQLQSNGDTLGTPTLKLDMSEQESSGDGEAGSMVGNGESDLSTYESAGRLISWFMFGPLANKFDTLNASDVRANDRRASASSTTSMGADEATAAAAAAAAAPAAPAGAAAAAALNKGDASPDVAKSNNGGIIEGSVGEGGTKGSLGVPQFVQVSRSLQAFTFYDRREEAEMAAVLAEVEALSNEETKSGTAALLDKAMDPLGHDVLGVCVTTAESREVARIRQVLSSQSRVPYMQ
jgi:hypothetical protein